MTLLKVAVFSKKVPKEFSNSISLLDDAISFFPDLHAMPFKLAAFRTGVSEYLKTA